MKMNQKQIFYSVSRQLAETDALFSEFVRDGLTREQLQRNIERRPSLWGRYEGFLPRLQNKRNEYR